MPVYINHCSSIISKQTSSVGINMNTSFFIVVAAVIGGVLCEPAGWGSNGGGSGLQGKAQGGWGGNQGGGSAGGYGNQGGNSWGGQQGGNGGWGGSGSNPAARGSWAGNQGGSGADSRSLFGPDGKRYGANLIEEPDRWGYEANIPGATSRFIGYRSANGRSGLGQDGGFGRSGQNGAYGAGAQGRQAWQQGGQQGGQQGWGLQGGQGGQQGWGQQGKQGW